jgi:hypothetical protein
MFQPNSLKTLKNLRLEKKMNESGEKLSPKSKQQSQHNIKDLLSNSKES